MLDGEVGRLEHAVIGAAMRVHSYLGGGMLEGIYGDALEVEFRKRGIPFIREAPLHVEYEGVVLGHTYRVDFLCGGMLVVELKAQALIGKHDVRQVANYLAATGLRHGLLLNFGPVSLRFDRVVPKSEIPVHLTPEQRDSLTAAANETLAAAQENQMG